MALTYLALQNLCKDSLGNGSPSTNTPIGTIINLAGRSIFNRHEWNHRVRPRYPLNFTANQAFVQLPTDFGTLIGYSTSTLTSFVLMTTQQLFDEYVRRSMSPEGFAYFGCVTQQGQASAESPMGAPVLEIYPTPTSDSTDAIRIRYLAKWRDLVNDTDYPNVPDWMEPLLVAYIQAWARGLQEEDEGSVNLRVAEVVAGPLWQDAVLADAYTQGDYGIMQGGQVASMGMGRGQLDYLDGRTLAAPA